MTDWNLVAKIIGGASGVTIVVLVILSLIAWIVGLVIQKTQAKGQATPTKGK